MIDYQQTVISQYAQSPSLNALLGAVNAWLDPAPLIDDFIFNVWDLDTATGYGLDVWGRIVGVGRVFLIGGSRYFGFNQQSNLEVDPFNTSPFYGGQQLNNNFILSDDGFRVLIRAKALSNICDGSIPGINKVLLTLFAGRGNAYVTNGRNMTMTYTFTFTPTPVEVAIISQSGILPQPVGVAVSTVLI
jgi:hypothetical protein